MKKFLFLMALAAVLQCVDAVETKAQILLGLPYEKIHTVNRKPVPYQYVREADVMWSKIVWRRIELSERANHHLYYPKEPQDGRMSLIDVLLEGIHTQGLTAYDESKGDEFATIMTESLVHERMGSKVSVTEVEDPNNPGVYIPVTINEKYNSALVKSYLLKELWFFDKQRSVMEVRIIGLCPIRQKFDEDIDPDHKNPKPLQTFWIYYPEARKILSNAECFNANNDAARLNYEDVFEKRLFSSYIYQESNVYDNRSINLYAKGEECLLEAERIKERIFNFEQDLWEY